MTSPTSSLVAQYLRSQWKENLGIESTWHVSPDAEIWMKSIGTLRPHLIKCGITIDRDGFMRGMISLWRDITGWSSAVYDGLVERAERVRDQAERARLFRHARELLIHEAAFMPLFYFRSQYLLKPWVKSYPLDEWEVPFWKDVITEPH